jgi:glycosyltransferase involved in cell wall biosynthesis
VERIGIYAGAASSPNVVRLLRNLSRMLGGEYDIDIVASGPAFADADLPDDTLETYGFTTPLGGIRALSQYGRQNDPAVLVQVTDPPIHGTVVGAVGARIGIPTVYRYSGDRFYEYRVTQGYQRLSAFGLGAVLGRVPLRLNDRFVALGPCGKRRLVARGVPATDVTILPPSIDTEGFAAVEPVRPAVPPDRKLVLSVGRLTRLKGKATLESVIPTILHDRDDLHFVCVGAAETGLEVPEECRGHVTLTGRVPPEAVGGYMAAADLLVHPSLTEGVPRVLLESLAAGTPVLAREVGDVPAVTGNTFRTDGELVDRLRRLESIPLDDVEPYTRRNLAPRYREFFARFCGA